MHLQQQKTNLLGLNYFSTNRKKHKNQKTRVQLFNYKSKMDVEVIDAVLAREEALQRFQQINWKEYIRSVFYLLYIKTIHKIYISCIVHRCLNFQKKTLNFYEKHKPLNMIK